VRNRIAAERYHIRAEPELGAEEERRWGWIRLKPALGTICRQGDVTAQSINLGH